MISAFGLNEAAGLLSFCLTAIATITAPLSAGANQPPQVLGISVSPVASSGGQTVHVAAVARDPEGQPMSFHWSTTQGVLTAGGDLDAEVDWTLPSGEGNFMLSLEVRDSQGGRVLAERMVPIGPIRSFSTRIIPRHQPTRIVANARGEFWVTDAAMGQVSHFSAGGSLLRQFDTAPRPLGIALTGDGHLLVGEDSLDRVARYSADGALQGTLGNGSGDIKMPNAIAVESGSGRIYVADSRSGHVRVFSADGAPQSTLGAGILGFPIDVAVCPRTAEVFVADQDAARIAVFSADGVLQRTIGSAGCHPGQFRRLQGVAVNALGDLFALDSLLCNIQLFDSQGRYQTTFGQLGDGSGAMRTPLGLSAVFSEQIRATSSGPAKVEVFVYWAAPRGLSVIVQ